MDRSKGELVCDLSALEPEEQQVVMETEERLQGHVLRVKELPDGLRFEFPGDRDVLETICKWLPLEMVCCPFLNFTLEVRESNDPIHLSMTGKQGVKEFLMQELGPDAGVVRVN